MSEKVTDNAFDFSATTEERVQETQISEGASEQEDGSSKGNIGFAIWALLWIGGTLFIKKDGNGCRM